MTRPSDSADRSSNEGSSTCASRGFRAGGALRRFAIQAPPRGPLPAFTREQSKVWASSFASESKVSGLNLQGLEGESPAPGYWMAISAAGRRATSRLRQDDQRETDKQKKEEPGWIE